MFNSTIETCSQHFKLNNNYCHGDFRSLNILVDKPDTSIKLIDFDWSGIHGQVKYPIFINNTQIKWPPSADSEDGKPILKEYIG